MLKNYFTVAIRNLYKQRGYTFINMFGLALGMASFMLILFFVRYEISYDRFYTDYHQIYRVTLHQPGNVYLGTDHYAVTPPPLASVLREDYPDVVSATSVRNQSALLSVGEDHFWEEGLRADGYFFDVFDLSLLQGDPAQALGSPQTIVLTSQLAKKIFGNENPINQQIEVEGEEPYTITGIIEDVPANASIKYSFITAHISHQDYARRISENLWGSSNVHTFLKLSEGTSAAEFSALLPDLVLQYRYRGNTDLSARERDQYLLQALADIHLGPFINFDIGFQGETQHGVKGNKKFVYLFLAIGVVILLLACINYMNLAISRSIKRVREVGLRKSVGANRVQIIGQFLSESILISLLALLVALLLVEWFTPYFSGMVKRPIETVVSFNASLMLWGLLLTLIVGTIAGSYPALYMSWQKPIDVLKGSDKQRTSRFSFQRILIVSQYTASIALVACAITIYQQLNFMRTKDAGYQKEQIVTMPIQLANNDLRARFEQVRTAWMRNPNISDVTASSSLPVYTDWQAEISGWDESSEGEVMQIYINPITYDFFDLFGLEMAAGRVFSIDRSSDATETAIINETAARSLGWQPQEALGKQFIEGRGASMRTIVGVVKDFHAHSLHHEIRPLAFYVADERADYASSINYISAKLQTENVEATLEEMRSAVMAVSSYPVEFKFVVDEFDQLYEEDRSLGDTIIFFTILALLIASLGLFGLAAYSAEQRTKEVGVRKVLGASAQSIVMMLLKEFTGLVLIAGVIATPLAYYAMQHWLEGFAYRITVGPEIFLITILSSVLIAVITVGNQTLKASLADPVKCLRYE